MTALLALVAALGGCTVGDAGLERDEYVNRNQNLFRALPRYPGSELKKERSIAYREEESGPIVGYSTLYELELPRGARADEVLRFYRQRLTPEWQLVEELDGPVQNFRRDQAYVSVNLESWRAGLVELAIDHAR